MTLLRAGRSSRIRIARISPSKATKNVHDMLGADVAYDVQIRDVTMVSTRPTSIASFGHAGTVGRREARRRCAAAGGILLAYLPTINRRSCCVRRCSPFLRLEETVEILRRTWHIDGAQCDRITGWSPTPDSLRARAVCERVEGI